MRLYEKRVKHSPKLYIRIRSRTCREEYTCKTKVRDQWFDVHQTVTDNTTSAVLALLWRHNDRDDVSNHQPHDCLLNRLFRRRSKKTSKLRVTGLCEGTGDQWIPLTKGQWPGKCVNSMTSSCEDPDNIGGASFKKSISSIHLSIRGATFLCYHLGRGRDKLTHLPLVPYGAIELGLIGSGNGLLPHSTKPLPEPMLTYHQWRPTFIKPDQRNPWIKDQLWNDLLSTILHLQLPNSV